jgi:hypothetical protein
MKIGDVVRFRKGVFDIIYNIKRTQDVFEKYVNYPDGFVYFLEDGFHYGRHEFTKAYLGRKSIAEEYVLWKLEKEY